MEDLMTMRQIPIICMDYAFTDRTDENPVSRTELTVLNIKDRQTCNMFPTPVPRKGNDAADYASRKTLSILKYLGHRQIVLRTDGEAAIEKLSEHVAEHWGPDTRTATETTPVGDSKSNGFIENANKFMEAQTRTLLSALSHTIGHRVRRRFGRISLDSDAQRNLAQHISSTTGQRWEDSLRNGEGQNIKTRIVRLW